MARVRVFAMTVQLARVRTDVFVIYIFKGILGRGYYERYDCSATYGTIVGAIKYC